MQSFESPITGHTYTLSLSYGRVEKINTKHKVDLLEENANEVFLKLFTGVQLRMKILWEMLDDKDELPVIKNPDFDPDEEESKQNPKVLNQKDSFYEILSGETLSAADESFWEEFKNFFQNLNPTVAEFLTKALEEYQVQGKAQMKAMSEVMDDPKKKEILNNAIEDMKKNALGQLEKQFGNSRDESK